MLKEITEVAIAVSKEYGVRVGLSVGGVCVALWITRHRLPNTFKLLPSKKHENVDEIIERALFTILWKMEADRAFLFEHSEYDRRLCPIPYAYTNNTFEVVNPAASITAEKENLQRIPLSSIPFWVERLAQNREVCVDDIESLRLLDPSTYQILRNQSIQSVYAVSLVDFCGVARGFVGVDFCQGPKELSDNRLESLRYEAVKIIGLLLLKER